MITTSMLESLKVCLLCNNGIVTRANKQVVDLQSANILQTFCQYMKLQLEGHENFADVTSLPFCESCSFSVYKLFKFHQEKARLEKHIELMVVTMTMEMMVLLGQTDESIEGNDDVKALREAAVKCYNPTVVLEPWKGYSRSAGMIGSKIIAKVEIPDLEEMSVNVDPDDIAGVSDYDSDYHGKKNATMEEEEMMCVGTAEKSKLPWIRKLNQKYIYNGVTYVHVGDGYECKSCGTKGKNIRKMIAHIQAMHKNERRLKFERRVKESGYRRGAQKNLWIKQPNQEYTYCRTRYCHVGDGYECQACGSKVANIRAMKKHIQVEHKGNRESSPPQIKFLFKPNTEVTEEKTPSSNLSGVQSSHLQKRWIRKEYQQYTYNKIVYCHVGDGYQCGGCGVKCKNIRAMKKHIQAAHKTGILAKECDPDDGSNENSVSTEIPAVVKSEAEAVSRISDDSREYSEQLEEQVEFGYERKPRKPSRTRGENQRYKYNGVVYIFMQDGYECESCGAKGRNIRAMKKHIQLVHTPTQKLPELDEFEVAPEKYEYEGCSFEKVGKDFKCGSCVFSQDSYYEIVGHIRECHIVGNDHLMEVRPGEFVYAGKYTTFKIGENYACGVPECKYETKSLRGALIHVRRSHIGDPKEKCICEICGKAFAYPKILQRHLKNHPRLTLNCKYCGKKCPGQYCLKVHELTHEGDAAKKLQCHICGKKFLFRQQLIGHEAAHNGEKNYECPECGKKFLWQSSLSTHRKAWHYKRKEFACQVCGATFRYKDSIRRHIIGVHKGFTSLDQVEDGSIPTYVRKRKRTEILQDQGQVATGSVANIIEHAENSSIPRIPGENEEHEEVQPETVPMNFSLWAGV